MGVGDGGVRHLQNQVIRPGTQLGYTFKTLNYELQSIRRSSYFRLCDLIWRLGYLLQTVAGLSTPTQSIVGHEKKAWRTVLILNL